MTESPEEKTPIKQIINLKSGEENVHIKGRVLEASPPRVIQTRRGPRTISNAVIGDETGRVQATLWGNKAGTLDEGQVVEIEGAWTTSFRGKVQINIGRTTKVTELSDKEAPLPEEIPEDQPVSPGEGFRKSRFGQGRRYYRQGRGLYKRGRGSERM